jgi:cytochrome c553
MMGSARSAVRAVSIGALAAGALLGALRAQQPAGQPAPAAPAPAAAAPAGPLQGNRERGKAISYTCLGCHGIAGYKNAYPMYSVPKLEGQNPDYLAVALHGYREGDRSHLTMHDQASTLSDQDIADIAAYFAGTPLTPGGKPPGTVPQAASLCTSCHGQDGVAIAPMYPSLAGQHEDYIERALQEYQKGGRNNPIMKGFAANLKDADIQAIARYFSGLTPSLHTEARPYTRFSAQ